MSIKKRMVREHFRTAVFKRDGGRCRVCGRSDVKLDAHHITNRNDMPNGGYVLENGITLCDWLEGCHSKAELVYFREEEIDGVGQLEVFRPGNLYELIGSSYELAVAKSLKL